MPEIVTNGAPADVLQNGFEPISPSPCSIRASPSLNDDTYKSLIDRITSRIDSGDLFFSMEFFPPKTAVGASNLFARLDRLSQGQPLFCDLTWHANSDPGNAEKPTSSISIASAMLNFSSLDTMLHMTCCNQTLQDVIATLDHAKLVGIRNILALRGDFPSNQEVKKNADGLNYGSDMVRLIRQRYGRDFVVCVAGYPNPHPDSQSQEHDLMYLKKKVDAGADFIITQLFFKAETFLDFVKKCRAIGIACPIIPGILPIQDYKSILNIVKISKLDLPEDMMADIESIKDNDDAVRKYGVDHAVTLGRTLLEAGVTNGLHIYTLNREKSTVEILKRLGLWVQEPQRALPWKCTVNHTRQREDVRPIFWSRRPKSYVDRTSEWEVELRGHIEDYTIGVTYTQVDPIDRVYPNGRWGDSSSATFGELTDYYLFYHKMDPATARSLWGEELSCLQDVWNVFYRYIVQAPNADGNKVTSLPWVDCGLSPETADITEKLAAINKRGVLTINSQPNVNCVPSTHPKYGWGPPGGYVFQKAYLEFFTSKDNIFVLKKVLKLYPQVMYHVISHCGDADYTNCDPQQPNAVTWGVFPGREILQPTVVDPVAFTIWKDEAFGLWRTMWADLYEEGSTSRTIIEHIHDNYYLVNLVDNDFPNDTCLWQIIDRMLEIIDNVTTVDDTVRDQNDS